MSAPDYPPPEGPADHTHAPPHMPAPVMQDPHVILPPQPPALSAQEALHIELLIDAKYSSARKALRAEAGLITLIAGSLMILSFIGLSLESGGIVALLTAFLPIPLWWALGMWIDRFDPEPVWLLTRAFLWGALVATLIAGTFNDLTELIGGKALSIAVSAPIGEETLKGMAILWVLRKRRIHFSGVLDGIVYAIFVASGFAVVENLLYYAEALEMGKADFAATLIGRGLLTPLAHPLFTIMTGIGIGLASKRKSKIARYLLGLTGLLSAIILHATWNIAPLIAYLPMLLILILLFVIIKRMRRREQQSLRTMLEPEVALGVLSEADILWLCKGGEVGSRKAWRIVRRKDPVGARQRDMRHVASHLAMLRSRTANRPVTAEEQQLEAQLVAYLPHLTARSHAGDPAIS